MLAIESEAATCVRLAIRKRRSTVGAEHFYRLGQTYELRDQTLGNEALNERRIVPKEVV